MSNRFEGLWARMIRLCADHLPWQATVDFRATEWPSMNLQERPADAGLADITRLSHECVSVTSVNLYGCRIELKYFPGGEFWSARGMRQRGLGWSKEVDFINGSARGGPERLDEFALRAFEWLRSQENVGPNVVGPSVDESTAAEDEMVSVDGQA